MDVVTKGAPRHTFAVTSPPHPLGLLDAAYDVIPICHNAVYTPTPFRRKSIHPRRHLSTLST